MDTVFISYTGFPERDRLISENLDTQLSWFDQDFPENGCVAIRYLNDFEGDFVEEISDALVGSDYVIALVSKNYLSSPWCLKEFKLAHKANKLIPVLIEDCDRTHLPPARYIDVRHLTDIEKAGDFIIANLDKYLEELKPQPLDPTETFDQIEQFSVILAGFEGEAKPGSWSQAATAKIVDLLEDVNFFLEVYPQIISSTEEANAILRQRSADIVVYGSYRGLVLDLGLVSSRGWQLNRGGELELPQDLRFHSSINGFNNLASALRLAVGNLEIARGRFWKANEYFELAVSVNYGDQYLFAARGRLGVLLKSYQQAADDYSQAIKIDPAYDYAYFCRAQVYEFLGKRNEAFQDYCRAIELRPEDPNYFYGRGMILFSTGNASQSLADFNRAIELDPEYSWAYNSRALLYQLSGQIEKAMQDFDRAVALDPSNLAFQGNRRMCDPAFSEELKRFQEYLRNGGDFRRYPGMTQA